MKTPTLPALMPLPPRPANPMLGSRGRRLRAFKRKHGILSFKSEVRMLAPWIVIKVLREDRGKDIGTIMSESCRLYDESGLCATGNGELSAVRKLCRMNAIPCPL